MSSSYVLPKTKHYLRLSEMIEKGDIYSEKWKRFDSAMDLYLKLQMYPMEVERPAKVIEFSD